MGLFIYVFFFAIPITIMFIGFHKCDIQIVKSGFSLLLYMYCAFIGSSIKETKKMAVNKKNLAVAIGMFLVSVAIVILGYRNDLQTLSTVFSVIMGCIAAYLMFKSNKGDSAQ